jgi:hypothetical protein
MVDASMDGSPNSEPCVAHERAAQVEVHEAMGCLNDELTDWALLREKVLDKLDLKAARRARQLSFQLRSMASQPEDLGETEEELADLLEACHALLEQRADFAIDSTPPPDSGIVECVPLSDGLPLLNEEDRDPEETAPGTRLAAGYLRAQGHRRVTVPRQPKLTSLVFDDDDHELEATRSGVPSQVMESYLAGIRNGSDG